MSHLNKAQPILLFRISISLSMKTKVNNETKEFHSNEDNEYYTVFLGVNSVTKKY